VPRFAQSAVPPPFTSIPTARRSTLHHPNVVLFLGACTRRPNLCLVLEFCVHGSLHHFLKTEHEHGVRITMSLVYRFALDIARGVYYLHRRCKIVQRDLKARNILVDESLNAKVRELPTEQEAAHEKNAVRDREAGGGAERDHRGALGVLRAAAPSPSGSVPGPLAGGGLWSVSRAGRDGEEQADGVRHARVDGTGDRQDGAVHGQGARVRLRMARREGETASRNGARETPLSNGCHLATALLLLLPLPSCHCRWMSTLSASSCGS
jgi:serine/threonine protein kinase